MTPLLAAPLLLALLCLVGQPIARRLEATAPRRLVISFLAGALALHVLLSALDLLGIRWSPSTVFAPLVVAALPGILRIARHGATSRSPRPTAPFGWGDGLTLLALLVFAAFAWSRWITFPDFIYHWGLKGHRFFITGGVDYTYLARPWSWVLHPDYPNLIPEVLATLSLLGGRWDEPTLMLLSPWILGLTVLAVREALVEGGVAAFERQAVVASVALSCGGFAIAYQLAGAADWWVALALAAAVRPLVAPPLGLANLELGLCAAFAAASKIEGLALACCLILVQLGRHVAARRWPTPAAFAALTMPAVVGGTHWLVMVHQHHLLQPSNAGALRLAQLAAAWPAIRSSLLLPQWHGAPLITLALPLLLLSPRLRAVALVASLQLGFYLWSYAATPVDVAQLVLTTLPRLLLHLLPAIAAAGAMAWLGAGAGEDLAASEAQPAPPSP